MLRAFVQWLRGRRRLSRQWLFTWPTIGGTSRKRKRKQWNQIEYHQAGHYYSYDTCDTTDDDDQSNGLCGAASERHTEFEFEHLLEPIRYSMAFLTLFSILSSLIVASMLVPFGTVQMLAQSVSIVVAAAGLLGTLRRSMLCASVYALAMLLFLFLQCSYFFVLIKLMQEVAASDRVHHSSVQLLPASTTPPASLPSSALTNVGYEQFRPSPTISEASSIVSGVATTVTSTTTSALFHPAIPESASLSSTSQYEPYTSSQSNPLQFLVDYSAHRRASLATPFEHAQRALGEELAYLSLLTVPMLAWLPPSLFMESVALLLLTMQAIAGACFVYALRKTQQHHRHRRAHDHEHHNSSSSSPFAVPPGVPPEIQPKPCVECGHIEYLDDLSLLS